MYSIFFCCTHSLRSEACHFKETLRPEKNSESTILDNYNSCIVKATPDYKNGLSQATETDYK